IFPMHSWKSAKVFLPALAFLGVVHTIRIMQFKSSGDFNFDKPRLAFAFGATDGALVILCLILALCIAKLAPIHAKQFEPVVFVAAFCGAFALPPLISPQITIFIFRKLGCW